MRITVNGKDREVADGVTVEVFIETLGLPKSAVAVELNREIVKKFDYSKTVLREGDKLEIVHFVGGG